MTKFTKVDLDITEYKPKMKPVYVSTVKDLRAIPVEFGKSTVQVKADGEFNMMNVDKHQCYAVNRFGRKTEDLPALTELHEGFLKVQPISEMQALGEMYAMKDGKPLTLPNFIHYLKGEDKNLQNSIHIGLFDIIKVTVRGKEKFYPQKNLMSKQRFDLLSRFQHGDLCSVLPYIIPKDWKEIEQYWTEKVQKEGWEGLVIRTNGDTYKAKPNRDVDAVIIGINKNTKGYEKGLAKSVRVALMRDDGNFVELGDATVPSEDEARELFALTRVKVYETPEAVFVRPIVVVQISYISLFPDTINAVRASNSLVEIGTTMFVRMKSPRVVGYRKDKKVCVQDIGINQVGE